MCRKQVQTKLSETHPPFPGSIFVQLQPHGQIVSFLAGSLVQFMKAELDPGEAEQLSVIHFAL